MLTFRGRNVPDKKNTPTIKRLFAIMLLLLFIYLREFNKVNSDFSFSGAISRFGEKAQLERLFFGLRLKAQNVYRDSQQSTSEMRCFVVS